MVARPLVLLLPTIPSLLVQNHFSSSQYSFTELIEINSLLVFFLLRIA